MAEIEVHRIAAAGVERLWVVAALLLSFAGCNPELSEESRDEWAGPDGRWVEVWRDDFAGPAGSAPDAASFRFEVGPISHNGEVQFYTDRRENAFVDAAGNLVLRALAEPYQGVQYTSARLNTEGLVEEQYGRVEARIRLPAGKGLWPAFWLLGANFSEVGWPACGEIDVVEFRGSQPNRVIGSVHGPGYSGGEALTRLLELESGSFADDFHVYALEWTKDGLRWLVDEQAYHSRTRAEFGELGLPWVFDQPFFVILNLAVGGHFDGNPDGTTEFPSDMLIDYVKISSLEASP